jgi:spore germination protein KA
MSTFNCFQNTENNKSYQKTSKKPPIQTKLSTDLNSNITLINMILGYASDLIIRKFTIASYIETEAAVIMLKGLTEKELINEQVIAPLMSTDKFQNIQNNNEFFETLKKNAIPNVYVSEENNTEKLISKLITGNTILLVDKIDRVLIIGSQGWNDRSVSEPVTENVVRGPRDGFIENIENNVALIRRRVKSPNLRVESLKIGTETETEVSIAYIEGITKKSVLCEIRKRLGSIKIDGILESGYIEELIEDNPWSPFPQIEHSERPDKVAAAILEGRVAILVDTTPFVLLAPTIFFQFIQSADDYYERFPIGSLTRFVRIVAYGISVIAPALYIALTSYHQEMIPTSLALSIAASREGVPFPSIGEAFLMEGTFEILREAGLRLPKQAGQAVSIVGGLVVGKAAVQAGIVSQAMVIVVALTGISSYAIPAFNAAAAGRLLRFPLMLLSSILGLPGILTGLSIIIIHMNSLRSFGVSYMDPFILENRKKSKDIIIRKPWWKSRQLPDYIARKRSIRMSNSRNYGSTNNSNKKRNN